MPFIYGLLLVIFKNQIQNILSFSRQHMVLLVASDNKITQVITVGFEEIKDMSYFMLACPHLKYN